MNQSNPVDRKLIYSSWYSDFGGGELRMYEHLTSTRFGRGNILVILNRDGPLRDRLEQDGFKVLRAGWKKGGNRITINIHWYMAFLRVYRVMERLRNAVCICNTWSDLTATGQVAAMLRRPLIWRARADTFASYERWSSGRAKSYIEFLNNKVSTIIPTTDYERAFWVEAGVSPEKIKVIHNGVDPTHYSNEVAGLKLRSELGIGEDISVLAFVARMVPHKGYEIFFKALHLLMSARPDVVALIAGDTVLMDAGEKDYKESIMELVVKLNIQDKVRFLGFRNDISTVMNAADVFVLASEKEPFGTTVLEAMAASRPVIASDLPGPRESVVPGETGFLFEPGNADLLARYMEQLLRHSDLRHKMGKAGKRRIEQKFDLKRNLRALDAECEKAVS